MRFRYLHMNPKYMDADGLLSGREVSQGEIIGKVATWGDFENGTSYHLHFNMQVFTKDGWVWVNPYMTLVRAYEKLIGGRGTEIKPGDPVPPPVPIKPPIIAHPAPIPLPRPAAEAMLLPKPEPAAKPPQKAATEIGETEEGEEEDQRETPEAQELRANGRNTNAASSTDTTGAAITAP